ncbi:putative UPF0481 protein At3g02645 [Prosopis cineraria]|uniref:putative UPF0481 protein At3g02645 n=1 Tax=Prosopis cineraria TaxID=364024 RepID=UPI0024106903|nr:putative UPF0481 protein At3g02645 [Prosopis cineraria]
MNEAAYTPTMVSIGPYHHGDGKLESMEKIKLVFLNQFLNRISGNSLGYYVEAIRNKEGEIRRSYSETISMTSDVFAILPDIINNVKLRKKFTFEYFIQHHLPRLPDGTVKVHHLCDMLRIFYARHDGPPREDNVRTTDPKPIFSASKLHDAGIIFEVKEDDPSLMELQYSKGVLKVPKIVFEDVTETILRNVVAFEQCHPLLSRTVTDYIILLHYLLNTGKDVELLVEKGIVDNFLEEDGALAFVATRLDRNVTEVDWKYYRSLFAELNEFYDNPYHKHKAIFKQQYLSTSWKVASFFGAIPLLFLT